MLLEFQKTMRATMHKSQTGMTMFCPACGSILDHKRAVSMDLFDGDSLVWSKVYCRDCYLQAEPALPSALQDMGGTRLDIYDGKTKTFMTYGEEPEKDNSFEQTSFMF